MFENTPRSLNNSLTNMAATKKFLNQLEEVSDNNNSYYELSKKYNEWYNNVIWQKLFPAILNRFRYETDNMQLKSTLLIAESWLFWIPNVGIYKMDDSYVAVAYTNPKVNNFGQIESADAQYLLNVPIIGGGIQLVEPKKFNLNEKLTVKNCVFLKNNVWNFPTMFYAFPYVKKIARLYQLMDLDANTAWKRIVLPSGVKSILKEKSIQDQFKSDEFIITTSDLSLFKNNISIKPESGIDTFLGYANFFENKLKLELGIRTNSMEKRERNSAQEGVFVEGEFAIYENYYFEPREIFVKQLNETFNVNVVIKKTSELDLERQKELDPSASNNEDPIGDYQGEVND